ncbi:hypothetical protein [Cellulomonas pakistanensis]|uniref:Camelysin metallo-endopeptidase n=1 Tax=Cellulomonas pakistanensis TaxID=992287 RepID=A0A919PBG3_9CELL|nr:hypothetical protein [Cellulomonas pakistanensis]GIG36586.1 hypothetical protein Cpa01nite_19670 [Cellulomonas pakistanensis]
MTTQTHDRKRRRKGLVAWGSLAGVAALLTTAAFTDNAFLNLGGANGIGGADSTYNIQVGATDAEGVFLNDGTWQEADDPIGVPVFLDGAQSLFPGSAAIGVEIPVRNDSAHFTSSLAISLAQLPDAGDAVTDANYLASLRFDVAMPATALAPAATHTGLTYDEVQALALNDLAAEEESVVSLSIRLLSQSESGAAWEDNTLSGKGAFVQAVLDGSSV